MVQSFRDAEHAGWIARAAGYDTNFTAITDQVIDPILSRLGDLSGSRILDVCCGPGHLVGAAITQGADAAGLDFAASMIEMARNHYPGTDFIEGDAANLPFPDEVFDHVVCAYGVMHLPDPDAAIAEAFRILRPGGSYVFTQWASDDDLLNIVSEAITAHGGPVADLPEAPPPMRFSDPGECRRVLVATGLENVEVERIVPTWTGGDPTEVLQLIMESATRAAMLIEAQAPERRRNIERAIVTGARARSTGDRITLRRATNLAQGWKRA